MAPNTNKSDEFIKESQTARTNMATEFWDFLKHNKKWWLAPILATMLLVGVLVVLAGTGAAPFIYTLF